MPRHRGWRGPSANLSDRLPRGHEGADSAMNFSFDIVVVGAGPAGLTAATAAAEAGSRVALLDENPHVGGQIWRSAVEASRTARVTARVKDNTKARSIARFKASGAALFSGRQVVVADASDESGKLDAWVGSTQTLET